MTNIASEHLKYIFTEDLFLISEPEAAPGPYERTRNTEEGIKTDPDVSEPETVRWWGANEKGILFITYDPGSEFLDSTDHEFLMKIIESGLRLSKQDIAITNCARFPYQQIRDEVAHEFLVFFGNQHGMTPSIYPQYEVIEEGSVKMLFAEPLKDIGGDRKKKLRLWNALKTMFNIK